MAVLHCVQRFVLLGWYAAFFLSQVSTVLSQTSDTGADQDKHQSVLARPGTNNECPKPYIRQSLNDISAKKVRPYLFGGSRTPCDSCQEGQVAEMCQFIRPPNDMWKDWLPGLDHIYPTHICDKERQGQILDWALKMDLYSMLQMTPCDLWPLVKQRSLWVVGDSEVRYTVMSLRR